MLNIADAVEGIARNRPNHPAIIEGARTISYGAFVADMRGIASGLLAAGLAPGPIVGVALRDTARYLTILYAFPRAGLIILPIDCRWTPAEKERVARHFGAALVLRGPGGTVAGAVPAVERADAWYARMAASPVTEFPPVDGREPLVLALSSGTTGRPKGPLARHRHFLRRFMTPWIDLGFT